MIIGLVGFIGSGKGTVADILVENFGFHKLSFAGVLKDAAAAMFSWDRAMLEGDTKESREWRECPDPYWSKRFGRPFAPREALQKLGTEAGRDVFHQDLWIFALEKRIEEMGNPNIVIADTRFPNEIEMIRKKHGAVVQIKRGEDPEWYDDLQNYSALGGDGWDKPDINKFMTKNYPEVHISEWAWVTQKKDYIIYNDSTLDELETNVNYMLTKFKGPCKIPA